jgi:STE24 endopeptidase
MTWTKSIFILLILGVAAAGVVGFVSRTPSAVRSAAPGRDATDPSLGADFTSGDIERHAAYRGPAYLSFALGTILGLVTLAVLARGPVADLVRRLADVKGGWVVRTLIVAAVVAVVLTLVSLPLGFVRGYSVAHAWGLSTQNVAGWISDQVKAIGIGLVFAGISALVFFGLVRWQPRWWWLVGWAAFTLLTVLLTFIYPIVVAPLFNRFTPLDDPVLERRALALADEAGVTVKEVLVADASRRTTAENAYVTGIGSAKRLVLYDTLLANGDDDETAFVIAHELGHKAENHVVKNLVLSSVGLLIGFAVLAWLSHRSAVWRWAGADGIGDIRALPLLIAFVTIAGLLTLPVQNGVSRWFERDADSIAFRLTGDPDTAIRVFRRLAFANLADLKPVPLATWVLFSHPPIPDRIRAAVAESPSAP